MFNFIIGCTSSILEKIHKLNESLTQFEHFQKKSDYKLSLFFYTLKILKIWRSR